MNKTFNCVSRVAGSFLLVLLLLSAGGLKAQAAFQAGSPIWFNDRLTRITDTLGMRGQEWGKQFNEALKTKKFAALRPPREAMERFVHTKISELRTMKDVGDSKHLRLAMIKFLEFEQSMLERAFKPMEKLSSATTKADLEAVFNQLSRFSAAESTELERITIAQEDYAKANGFRIETVERPK